MKFFGLEIELPIPLIVENIGVIHITRNNTRYSEIKYINIWFHYTRDLHENKIVVLEFVRSENNKSDIMTKNPIQKKFEKHSPKLVSIAPIELLVLVKKNREGVKILFFIKCNIWKMSVYKYKLKNK